MLAAALVTQSYGGQMSVVPNLSDHDCAEAQCIAKYGESCDEHAAFEARLEAEAKAADEARRADPLCRRAMAAENAEPPRSFSVPARCMIGTSVGYMSQAGDIKTAMCVR
jgi:hypothetical protein